MSRVSRQIVRFICVLLLAVAAGCDSGEQRAWEEAESANSVQAYRSFLASYPDSSLARGLALKRLEEATWESVLEDGTVHAFETFVCQFPASQHRTEIGGFSVNTRRRIENRIIYEIAEGRDLGDRFVLDQIEVNAETLWASVSRGGRFQIEAGTEGGLERLVLSTGYPGDWFPLEIGNSVVKGDDGSTLVPGLQSVHYTRDTVWRISGTIDHLLSRDQPFLQRYIINGAEADPLSFYLLEGTGAVYLHGHGSIKKPNGETIFSTERVADSDSLSELVPEEDCRQDSLPNSVAMLPFLDSSPYKGDSNVASALHEQVLNRLSRIGDLNVISRTIMMSYADSELTSPQIARELNVEAVLSGTVFSMGNHIMVAVDLIDVLNYQPPRSTLLWIESYNQELDDIHVIESDIVTNVASALGAELSPEEQSTIESRPSDR